MPIEYLTVDHLSTKDLIRIFSKICIHPDLLFNGTPCWIWCAARHVEGYGRVNYQGKGASAHRLLFAWTTHPLPLGAKKGEVDHLCRRPSCCNPAHLDFVPHRINTLRGDNAAAKNARKTHCLNGHPLNGTNLFYEQGKRQCRACNRTRKRLRHHTEKGLKYYHATREARKERHARWRKANKDKIHQYYLNHRERLTDAAPKE